MSVTPLTGLTEAIKNSLDNKQFGFGIFVDLQKAFDTVNYDIFLMILEPCGIRESALDWFNLYLPYQKQDVSVNYSNSSPLNNTCGVSQGSVLGHLFFKVT